MSNLQGKPVAMPVSDALRLELVGGDSCVLDAEGHCITCSDEALPARVLHIDQEQSIALVEINNESVEVDITLVDEVMVGSWLLVHGGVGIATMVNEEGQPIDEASDA
ncbi:MAG TPA: HypC/HybG/HupF family hydrogenase formation chaperone [Ktedonobacteraceae bacterium]|nr:HypC/HybG/HupF family hydrogenase formation chaperone [Ktedonobacteraceae bacterium]